MDPRDYKEIVACIQHFCGLSRDCLKMLKKTFPSCETDTLCSIMAFQYQCTMKAHNIKTTEMRDKCYKMYNEAVQKGDPPGILVGLARKLCIPPVFVGKMVLEKQYEDKALSKRDINKLVKDTSLISDNDLALEIYQCTLFDDLYSPTADVIRRAIGQEYEVKLYRELTELGIAFRDEEYLRKYGYDKTPDAKLEVPVAIDGFVVNWIESKALFGDCVQHKDYVQEQYNSYWNRFGSGLVIYWLGYVKDIQEEDNKRFLIRDFMPKNVTFIVPPKKPPS